MVEVITQVRDAALAMVSSPEGAKVLCLCLGMGTAKVPTTQLPRLPLLHPSHGPSNPSHLNQSGPQSHAEALEGSHGGGGNTFVRLHGACARTGCDR